MPRPLAAVTDRELAELIGVYNQLSPENLSCDGELPRHQVERRYAELQAELSELEKRLDLAPTEEATVYDLWAARGRPSLFAMAMAR